MLASVLLVFWWNFGSSELDVTNIELVHEGEVYTLAYKAFFTSAGKRFSPWHDIPLRTDRTNVFNFVCEIPRGATAKMEINKETESNPIIQDVKKGKPRYYHDPSLVNYGAIPQTWEDTTETDEWTGLLGDGDPVDVVDISSKVAEFGEVYPVKVLGALAMADGGEADWKIVVIRADDRRADELDDVTTAPADVVQQLDEIRTWFRIYKTYDGKPENEFSFDGAYQNAALAVQVVERTHQHWVALVADANGKGTDYWLPSDANLRGSEH